jgi:hemolysin activation/secretion protein
VPTLAAIQRASAAFGVLAGICLAAPGTAGAQGVRAGTVTDQFEQKAKERALAKPVPPALPNFATSQTRAERKPLFVLTAVNVAGTTVAPREEIAGTYAPFLRRPVSQADLLKITEGIAETYRRKGYALSRALIPPQDVKDGRVTVNVVEGYIGDILVEGDDSRRFGAQDMLQHLTAERPLRLATFERALLLLSDTPGLRIKDTILKEIGEGTGRFHLTVQLETWRAFANVDLDNRGAPETGPLQSFITTAINSTAVKGDIWALNVLTVPNSPEELVYVGGVVDVPLGTSGIRFGFKGSHSDIRPDSTQGLLDTRTKTDEVGVHAGVKVLRSREVSLGVGVLANIRRAEEHNLAGLIYDDRVRGLTLFTDLQVHDKHDGSTYLVVGVRQGHGEPGSVGFALSRAHAEGSFQKAYWSATRLQNLGGAWSALLSTSGQVASSPLLQSEQFYIGGPLLGRAYSPGALSGDSGVAGLLEIRFDQRVEIGPLLGYQLYAFIDGGAVWTRGYPDHEALSSFGVGVRFAVQDEYRLSFEVAIPVQHYSPTALDGGPRFFFSLSTSFRGCPHLWCSR